MATSAGATVAKSGSFRVSGPRLAKTVTMATLVIESGITNLFKVTRLKVTRSVSGTVGADCEGVA